MDLLLPHQQRLCIQLPDRINRNDSVSDDRDGESDGNDRRNDGSDACY
jgi:hypothetical protein